MPISKPFAIATEGKTIDGRVISRDWIIQMAKNYSPKVYTAVANLEHYLSMLPDSVFSACGNVVSLTTREVELLGEKKLQLLAVVDAADSVVELQKAGKKAFASMEVVSNFLDKGFAYLTGLAFTDTPASIGTESMKFSAAPANVYSFADELEIEWEAATAHSAGESLFSKVVGLLTGKDKKDEDRFADTGKAIEAVAESQRTLLDQFAALQTELKAATDKLAAADTAAAADRQAFADLKASLDKTAANSSRPAAAGGDGRITTDC